jgi:hypothetical protein
MPVPQTPILAAPTVEWLPRAANKWRQEYEAFQRLRPQLLAQYAEQYVVVHEGKIVDHGPDDVQLALKFFAEHGNVPVHIGLVSEQPHAIARVPHYRDSRRTANSPAAIC